MQRRSFIALLGGTAATWPMAARAQPGERIRRVGMLMHLAAADPIGQAGRAAFLQGLQQLGWTDGRNVRIDMRWAGGVRDLFHQYAAELVALGPDVVAALIRGSGPIVQGGADRGACS
jgi:putative ABC transport system substrate-binding protein